MQRTRDQIVGLLNEQGNASVSELARAVGVSEGPIRRHLDIMAAEGLVMTQLQRQPRGRPATRYSLSEAGEERSASANYSRLLDRLFPALQRLPQEAVSGRSGPDLLERLFEQLAQDVASEYAPRVRGAGLGERVAEVTDALRGEGILDEARDEGSVFRLRNMGCPYRSAAEGTHVACDADRRAIELLLDAPVKQVTTIAGGAACCEYVVAKG
ncbi:MAG: ArsR family transcriptional regulator [Dehalococcoidia bacterium]|nr:ArsR family transcriptional regulator [Dehalococcoidia bacterium]